jgi:hypothetical protein
MPIKPKSGLYYVLSYVVSEDRYAVLGTYDVLGSEDLTKKPLKLFQHMFDRDVASESHDDLFLIGLDMVERNEGEFVPFRKEMREQEWLHIKDCNLKEVELDHENQAATLYYPSLLNRSIENRIEYLVKGGKFYRRNPEDGDNWDVAPPPNKFSPIFGEEGIVESLMDLLEKKYPNKSIKVITAPDPFGDMFDDDENNDDDDDEQ